MIGQQYDTCRYILSFDRQLQVLIILVCMKLDSSSEDHPITEQTADLRRLDAMFTTRLGQFPSHGPLLLAWAVTRCGQVGESTCH